MQTQKSCLFLTVIGFIHTSLKERDYKTREKFRILKESRSTDIGIYILSVYVSVMPFSGSPEQVFVKLFGTKGESEEVCIQSRRLLINLSLINPSVPGAPNWRFSIFENRLHEIETSQNVVDCVKRSGIHFFYQTLKFEHLSNYTFSHNSEKFVQGFAQ